MTIKMLRNYISADPKVLSGKPVFRGTRIAVYSVLELLAGGVMADDIVSKDYYPSLSLKHIQAALDYSSRLFKNEEVHSFASVL